jgi:hypothetical protein
MERRSCRNHKYSKKNENGCFETLETTEDGEMDIEDMMPASAQLQVDNRLP